MDCLKQQLVSETIVLFYFDAVYQQQQLEQSKDTINEKDKEIKQLQAEVECLKRQQVSETIVLFYFDAVY